MNRIPAALAHVCEADLNELRKTVPMAKKAKRKPRRKDA